MPSEAAVRDPNTRDQEMPAGRDHKSGLARGSPKSLAASVRLLVAIASLLVVIGGWQLLASTANVSPIILPTPTRVINSLWQYVTSAQFVRDISASGTEFVFGFVLGCASGVLFGVIIGYFRLVRWAVAPWLNFFIAIPVFALSPLMLVWLGTGLLSKVAIVFLSCLFPVVINTIGGVQNVDDAITRMANSFGISRTRYFTAVVLPSSIPYIVSGIRLAVGYGLIGVFVAELTGAQNGIGATIVNAGDTLDTARLFAGLLVFGLAGLLLTALLLRFERRFSVWKPAK